MLRSKLKEKDAKGYAKRKALRLSDGAAGDAARSKLKEMNAKGNAKAKERARANAEARMLANPSMAVQIQTVQEISSQAALVLARTNIIPGLDGILEELMGSKSVMHYIWLSGRDPPQGSSQG